MIELINYRKKELLSNILLQNTRQTLKIINNLLKDMKTYHFN